MSIVGRSRYGRVRTNVYTTDATSINVQLKGIFDETLGRFINIIKYKSDEQSNISSLNYIVHKFFSDSLTTIGVTSATDKQFNPSATVLLFAALFEVDIDSLFEQNILTSSHKKFQMHFFVPQMSLLKSFIDQSPITTQFKVVFFIYVSWTAKSGICSIPSWFLFRIKSAIESSSPSMVSRLSLWTILHKRICVRWQCVPVNWSIFLACKFKWTYYVVAFYFCFLKVFSLVFTGEYLLFILNKCLKNLFYFLDYILKIWWVGSTRKEDYYHVI